MFKTILIALGCSVAAATAAVTYVARTVIGSPFQMGFPYNSTVKAAPDPANVWSWHHDFPNVAYGNFEVNLIGRVVNL